MRGSIAGSSVVHLALLAALMAVRTSAPLIVPGPDVIQVALVEAPSTLIAQPVPAPRPELEAPDIAATEEEGIQLEKKPQPKPEPRKEPEPREPERPASPTTALPYAPAGSAGLRGQIALDVADFEFTYYLLLVRNRIAASWAAPAGIAGSTARAVVYFRIRRSGEVTAVRLEQSSSLEFFDRAALRAVTISNPLPPLPLGYAGSELGVHFGFEYTAP